jgi:hypothetical protein
MEKVDLINPAVETIPHGTQAIHKFQPDITPQFFMILPNGAVRWRFIGLDMSGGETPKTGSQFGVRGAFEEQKFAPAVLDEINGESGLWPHGFYDLYLPIA